MKLEYIKPDLEELELMLEGSFLASGSKDPNNPDNPGLDVGDGEGGGDDDGNDNYWD